MNGSVDGWMGGLMDRSADGSMDGWAGGCRDRRQRLYTWSLQKIYVIDGLRAHEDHCIPIGPTVLKLNSQNRSAIVRSRAAATTFSNIGLSVCIRPRGVFFYKLGRVTSSTSFHTCRKTMAAGSGDRGEQR